MRQIKKDKVTKGYRGGFGRGTILKNQQDGFSEVAMLSKDLSEGKE